MPPGKQARRITLNLKAKTNDDVEYLIGRTDLDMTAVINHSIQYLADTVRQADAVKQPEAVTTVLSGLRLKTMVYPTPRP